MEGMGGNVKFAKENQIKSNQMMFISDNSVYIN